MTKWNVTYTNASFESYRFAEHDQHGREIGVVISIADADWYEVDEDAKIFWTIKGGPYSMHIQITRDGDPKYENNTHRWFETKEQRQQAIETYLRKARERARKQAQKRKSKKITKVA